MASRFQNSLEIGRASRIHFKKAGPVLGLGFKGGSFAIGKNETFVHVDVLGTGMSSRVVVPAVAINGSAAAYDSVDDMPECQAAIAALRQHSLDGSSLEVRADVTMAGFITFRYADTDELITDPVLIQGIAQLPEIGVALKVLKHEQERIWDDVCMEMVDMNREIIDLYRLMSPVIPSGILQMGHDGGAQVAHRVASVDDDEPKRALAPFFTDDAAQIDASINEWIESLALPVALTAQVQREGGLVCIDIDLPEPKRLPKTGVKKLPGGQVKVFEKTPEQLRQDYATCVLGLCFFVAANVLNLNVNIKRVLVSGFRVAERAGKPVDECLYSVLFPREQMVEARVADPIKALGDYTHRAKLSSGYDFAPVEPCDPADFSTL